MSRTRIAFCYRYGLLGGVSAQLLNRYPYLSSEYDISIIYESDHGMVSRFPAGVAQVAPTIEAMQTALRAIRPDITVVIDSPNFLDAWRGAGSIGRLVLEVHTTTANLTYLNAREQLAGIAHIVTVSSYMEKLLGVFGLGDLAPITVVPNVLDDRWSKPSPAQRLDGRPVVWVGKLDGHKRWRTAVDIMDDLAQERDLSVLPILVGGLTAKDAEVQALTTRLATSPGLARGVWWPRVEYDRMPALFSSVGLSGGVHLCTTSNESFGMAVAESLVRGCPVVAPDVGALSELLPRAALFKPGDWTEARQKARQALVDPDYRAELLSTADQVRALTSPERVLDAYRAVVDAVLASKPSTVEVSAPVSSTMDSAVAARSVASTSAAAAVSAPLAPAPADPSSVDPSSPAVPPLSSAPSSVVPAPNGSSSAGSAPAGSSSAGSAFAVPAPRVSVPVVDLGQRSARPAGVAATSTPARPVSAATPTAGGAVVTGLRTPSSVASIENLTLSAPVAWVDVDLVPGATYRLRSVTEGTADTAEKAAIMRFEVAEGEPDGGRGLTLSPTVGPYLYLTTGQGPYRTDRIFTVAKRVRRFGLSTWDNRGPVTLRTLTIEKVDGPDRPVDFFLSFDIEALPGRAPSNLIDRLIWGKLDDGGEYGIGRICGVLEQYGLKGNFMLDYASCERDGAPQMRRIVDFLAGRGHEIHLHLHSEWLARWWGLDGDIPVYFDNMSYPMARRMLDFTMKRHLEYTGQRPRVFRAGGFRVNPEFVLAAGGLGLEALTNVRNDMLVEPIPGDPLDAREPFVWDNGILEIPVDLSPEPLSEAFEKYLGRFDAVVPRKATERTFNLVMHSWSLMRRNEEGVHDAFDPQHEERLHQICRHVAQHGQARGYSEYLDQRHLPRPTVRLARLAAASPEPPVHAPKIAVSTCNVCDAVLAVADMESDICPGCGSRARHRQLKHVLDTYGNVFDGRSVLACHATAMEQFAFLTGTTNVVNFDVRPIHGRDLQMDIQRMDLIEDSAFDGFLALHVMNHVSDDNLAVSEIARVLKKGGVFVSTVPYVETGPTVALDDVTGTYGVDAFEQFGVGSYRQYGHEDYLALLRTHFEASALVGIDPVTNTSSQVYVAYKG